MWRYRGIFPSLAPVRRGAARRPAAQGDPPTGRERSSRKTFYPAAPTGTKHAPERKPFNSSALGPYRECLRNLGRAFRSTPGRGAEVVMSFTPGAPRVSRRSFVKVSLGVSGAVVLSPAEARVAAARAATGDQDLTLTFTEGTNAS